MEVGGEVEDVFGNESDIGSDVMIGISSNDVTSSLLSLLFVEGERR